MEKLRLRKSARKDSQRIEKLVYNYYFSLVPKVLDVEEEEIVCKKVVDKDGNILINLTSIWAIIDSETRKPIFQCPFSEKLVEEHLPDELPFPKKIDAKEETFLVEERLIHYSDVDLNGHLNNVKYIELLTDVHDSLFHHKNAIKILTMNYLKEIKEGSRVQVMASKGNPELVEIKSDDQVCFTAHIEYK